MANNLILFDFNNLACRCIHQRGLGYGTDQRSWDLLAYMIFTIMYDFVIQCTEHFEPGDTVDVVLALDSKDGYWRRDLYPPYKADRAEKRAAASTGHVPMRNSTGSRTRWAASLRGKWSAPPNARLTMSSTP